MAPSWEKNGWQKRGGKKADREIKNVELIKLYKAYTTQRINLFILIHTLKNHNRNSVEWRLWHGNDMADWQKKRGANER